MFDTVSAHDAAALVKPPDALGANRLFAGVATPDRPDGDPDHWQDGDGLSAPLPAAADPNRATYMEALERSFVTEDCIGDVLERRCSGVLGKEPGWSFERDMTDGMEEGGTPGMTPPSEPGEDPPPDEELEAVTAAVSAWWDRVGAHDVLKRFVDGLGYGGRSYLRLYVPPGRLNYNGDGVPTLDARSPADALRHIFVQHLDPDQAVIDRDKPTMLDLGVAIFAPESDDIADPVKDDAQDVEMTYLDGFGEDPLTVIRVIDEEADDTEAEPVEGEVVPVEGQRVAMDLRGNLTLFEGCTRPLVDAHMRANQKDLNTARTMHAISNHKAAFPSLVFIGVKPPTEEVTNAAGQKEEVAVGYENGPGQVGFFTTYPEQDREGNQRFTAGSVTQLGPVDNTNLRESADVARVAIYRRAKQLHVLAMKGANLSGEALMQAQGEYLNDLLGVKGIVDRAGKWMLETAYAMAEVLASGGAPSKDIRAVFDCRPNAGPLSSDMRRAILEMYDKKVISLETTMSLLGVDDVEAERDRLRKDREDLGPVEAANLERTRLALQREPGFSGDGQAGAVPDVDIARRIEEQAAGGGQA